MKWGVMMALALGALASAAEAKGPRCDECKDLPRLYRELVEQEWLRDRFARYLPAADRMLVADDVGNLQDRVTRAFNDTFYPQPSGPGGGKAPQGAPAFGMDPRTPKCELVTYRTGKDGKQTTVPFSEAEQRRKECKTLVDYPLAHERHHQRWCQRMYAAGTPEKLFRYPEVAANEVEAYQAGIDVLKAAISSLAFKCGWEGTTRGAKDGGPPVPDKKWVEDLQKRLQEQAKLLRTRRRR